ncbi:radical SAM protein [Aquimarina sp. 2201CG14-23]|uniref:radical SAM protein n=1 Tax=Aquimarina mycalae TaxID=3040073 RepID=UPI00247816CA|nr:radical SAM protein [Aquimarina sp. 2201CG14-23]MDH7446473.1 radical SAM protein [Aquimarina sp. 2201CG14-23]
MQFDALILKVASRCNLNCSYCFMYNLGDTTYKGQPKFMSYDMIDSILEKTKKYILKYNKKEFSFIFHGGEPLLIDKDFYRTFIAKANKIQDELKDVVFKYDVQTNGVLIDKDWCALFRELQIYPSISVDGTKKAHDMFRVDHKGNGSYDNVFNAVKLLKNKIGYADTVCVINIKEEPLVIYESFKKMQVNSVNFLIPDFTHDNYPFDTEKTMMADWLVTLFDIWINDPDRYKIPMFIGLINSLLGVVAHDNNESTVLVIETNGEIEAIDSLKACGHGFTKSGMNVQSNDFSDIKKAPLGKLYFEDSTTKLCDKCLECPIKEVCKGGRLVHRFKKENGFNNPSVYCKDLIKFIAHIQNRLIILFPELYTKENVDPMKTDEITRYINDVHEKDLGNSIYAEELSYFGQN